MINEKFIARLCHNVNKAYCESIGDHSQPSWEEAPEWMKESTLNGVESHLAFELTPIESHKLWAEEKLEAGWVYGKVKDPENKTHPCLVEYHELPVEERTKDYLFKAVVDSFDWQGE